MKCTIQKQGDCYLPYDEESVDLTSRKKDGALFVVDIKQARNPRYHARAMKMLRIMFEMVDEQLLFDPWRKMLTIKAGYFTAIGSVDINGTVRQAVEAQSLCFENMDNDEFKDCFLALHRAFIQKYGELLTMDQLNEWAAM